MGGNISKVPETMKRLVLVQGNSDITKVQIKVEEIDVPQPKSGQVLIRVCAAPVNPSDYGIWKRAIGTEEKKDPIPMGKEGSGIVVRSGGGMVANRMVGKKVGFVNIPHGQGSYSEYVVVTAMTGAFPLPESVPVEAAASFFVNPYTAYGIWETSVARGSPGCVHTAAASQLGQMLVKFTKDKENFTLINVVRRQEQADILKKIGAEHVVVTGNNENWKTELKKLMDEHKINCAFDCISGEMTGDLVTLMPNAGNYFTYGGLSGQPCSGINPIDMIYRKVKVEGFFLTSWLTGTGQLNMIRRINRASAAILPALDNGWSSSQFKDCTLDNMFEEFCKMWATGFTNQKLRIRMVNEETEVEINKAVAAAAEDEVNEETEVEINKAVAAAAEDEGEKIKISHDVAFKINWSGPEKKVKAEVAE